MTTLRSALFNLFFVVGTALVVTLGLPMLAFPQRILAAYIRLWAHGMIGALRIICGIRLEVTGLAHIPPGPAVIAAKHQSAFDTIVWLLLVPDCVYVLKKELLNIPLWGWFTLRCGHLAVDREGGGAALRNLVRGAKQRFAEGRPVVIFPEGTRTAPGDRQPYQPGVAALATAGGVPVVPVATDSGLRWGRRAFRKSPGVIHVSILPPLPIGLPRAALMAALEAAIETETDRLLDLPGGCG